MTHERATALNNSDQPRLEVKVKYRLDVFLGVVFVVELCFSRRRQAQKVVLLRDRVQARCGPGGRGGQGRAEC